MKKIQLLSTLIIAAAFCLNSNHAEAQILKKIGKKVERSVQQRVDRKIDRGIDKGLDKVEDGVDQSVKDATKEKQKEEKASALKKETGVVSIESIEATPYSEQDAERALENNGMVLVSANCNDFAWFKKGAFMEFEVKSSDTRKGYTSKVAVKDVRTEGDKTIADVVASDNEGHEFEMNYICSGNQLYFDLSQMLKSALEKQGQDGQNMEISFDGGLMSIPKNLYPGQELKDAVFVMNMGSQGMNIEMVSSLKDRKVVGKESVTTPAGTFNCIKMTGVRTTKMKMFGSNRDVGKPMIEEMYFAPSIGVVKSVSKTEKGKVEYEQQLIRYEL